MNSNQYIGKYYDFENKAVVDIADTTISALLHALNQVTTLTSQASIAELRGVSVLDQDGEGAHLVVSYDLLDEDEYENKPIRVLDPITTRADGLCMLEIRFENSNLLSDFHEIVVAAEHILRPFMDAHYLDVSYSSVAGDDPDPVGFFRVYFRQ